MGRRAGGAGLDRQQGEADVPLRIHPVHHRRRHEHRTQTYMVAAPRSHVKRRTLGDEVEGSRRVTEACRRATDRGCGRGGSKGGDREKCDRWSRKQRKEVEEPGLVSEVLPDGRRRALSRAGQTTLW